MQIKQEGQSAMIFHSWSEASMIIARYLKNWAERNLVKRKEEFIILKQIVKKKTWGIAKNVPTF